MALLQVMTDTGLVEGLTAGNQSISLFKGIPFAEPPVGDLRWKAPQPVKPGQGVLKAYKFAPICVQERRSSEGGIYGSEFYVLDHPMSEDCLYLNVWTPAKSADEKLPVGVYVHGGGWSGGAPLRQTAAIAAACPLLFEPGTKVTYSNTGIDIGAAIVEVVAGQRWEDFLEARVLAPLGMESSSFKPTDGQLETQVEMYDCVENAPVPVR